MPDHQTKPERTLVAVEDGRLGCHGDRASSLIIRCDAGKMPAFQARLEAYPTMVQAAFKLLLFLLCIISPGLLAQDETSELAAPAKLKPVESRLISDSELEDYLETLAAMLPMATQERDPFGAMQDPDAVPTTPLVATPDSIVMPEFSTPFEDIVRMIKVSTVMPADRKFLIGTRSFGVNDVVTFNYRGQPIRARVEAVSAREIRFRNLDTNHAATRTLDLMPAGMSAGGASRNIPGLIPTGPDVPIDLD